MNKKIKEFQEKLAVIETKADSTEKKLDVIERKNKKEITF